MSIQRALLAALLVASPGAALAHTGHVPVDGLMAGFLHPVTGADHLLAMVAIGVLAAQLGGRVRPALPLVFLVVMAVGGLLGAGGLALPAVEAGILASVVILGLLIALGRPLPQSLALSLAALFALFHGHAHGAEMPAASGLLTYGAGFLLATAGLHGLGLALGTSLARIERVAWIRYTGAAIALLGLGLFAA